MMFPFAHSFLLVGSGLKVYSLAGQVWAKNSNRHWNKRQFSPTKGNTPIIGAVERQGNVIARVLKRVTSEAMLTFVQETVSNKVSLLATDSWPSYSDYLRQYPHEQLDHKVHQYVVGAVHTNTIEGFWSIFKRGVVGTFHKVSAKYMPLYVAVFQLRYNNRHNADIFGAAILGC